MMPPKDSDLLGTWFMSNVDVFPDEDGILVFRPDGICIQFPSSVSMPPIAQTFRLWYSCPDMNTIEYKMKPDGREWFRYIERHETGWTMVCDEVLSNVRHYKKFPCRRAMPHELPVWFDEMMERNLAKMASLLNTKSTEAGTSNGG
jgi:hypothetical protein